MPASLNQCILRVPGCCSVPPPTCPSRNLSERCFYCKEYIHSSLNDGCSSIAVAGSPGKYCCPFDHAGSDSACRARNTQLLAEAGATHRGVALRPRPQQVGDNSEPANQVGDNIEMSEEELQMLKDKYPTDNLPNLMTLFGLSEEECGRTEKSMKRTTTCFQLWCVFCMKIGRTPAFHAPEELEANCKVGLGLYYPDSFTPTTADMQGFDKRTVGQFFTFLSENAKEDTIIERAKNWMNGCLNCEYLIRMRAANHRNPERGDARIGKIQAVKAAQKGHMSDKSKRAFENFKDMHEYIDPSLTTEEIRRLMLLVFEFPADSPVARMNPMNRLIFASASTSQCQTVRRGDQHYNQLAHTRYCERHEKVGPAPGTLVVKIGTDRAKHNQMGRVEIMGLLPCADPIRCSISMHGLLWLHRLVVLKEKLPKLDDYKKLFRIPSYPATRVTANNQETGCIPAETLREIYRCFYTTCGIDSKKLTSLWRQMAVHEMDDDGIRREVRNRMTGHGAGNHEVEPTKAQKRSYETNIPLEGVLQRALFDVRRDKKDFLFPRMMVSDDHMDAVLLLIDECRVVIEDYHRVMQKRQDCQSRREALDHRLVNGTEAGFELIHELRNCLLMLASRPVHPLTLVLQATEPCYFDRYRNSPTFRDLFSHDAFKSQEWKDLVQQVRQAEDIFHGETFHLSASGNIKLDAMQAKLADGLNQIRRFNEHGQLRMTSNIDQTKDEVVQLRELVHQLGHQNDAMFRHLLAVISSRGGASLPTTMPPPPADTTLPARSVAHHSNNNMPVTTASPPDPMLPQLLSNLEPVPALPSGKKRQRQVRQELALGAEVRLSDEIPRPNLVGIDANFTCAEHYYRWYKTVYLEHEKKYGLAWRVDLPIVKTMPDGKRMTVTPNSRATWFSSRRPIWMYIENLIEVDKMEESAALI